MNSHCFSYRPYDYMYDPLFSVSGPTDHYKAAVKAKLSTAKFQICPIFPNMFSDLKHYPCKRIVKRASMPIPRFEIKRKVKTKVLEESIRTSSNILGADQHKFINMPIINFPPRDILPYRTLATFHIKRLSNKKYEGVFKSVGVNTQYRDEEAQTTPWEPPCTVIGEGTPELLLLDFLKWGEGLPAGMHEVELIERARMKRAWEKSISPDHTDPTSMENLRQYLEALEIDEWAFREAEIQQIQNMRMELLENMLEEMHDKNQKRSQQKLESIISRTIAEKDAKLAKIKRQSKRDMRKLEVAARGVSNKYHKIDIVEEHVQFKSEIYAPLMRHGEHPKRWHHVIDEKNKKYEAQFIGVENISTVPKWLTKANVISEREIDTKVPTRHICMRETKWTTPVLKELHDELKQLSVVPERKSCSLLKRIEAEATLQYTAEVKGIPDLVESRYQAVVKLQSIIRGRATQVLIYEGRDRCRKLIETLRSSEGLLQIQKEEKMLTKLKVKGEQRKDFIRQEKSEQLKENLEQLRGRTVGTLLDFLNKELRRLLIERKSHALCLSLERELNTREATEAGRRQRELRRRREHDEIFKQVVKVHQDTVDMYLRDIIAEGLDFASKEEAAQYVLELAGKIDEETEEIYKKSKEIGDQQETVAELLHHFLLPQVNKELVRKNILLKQQRDLKTIHNEIFNLTERLPKSEYSEQSYATEEDTEHFIKDMLLDISQDAETVKGRTEKFIREEILEPIVDTVTGTESKKKVALPDDTDEEIQIVNKMDIEEYLTDLDCSEHEETVEK